MIPNIKSNWSGCFNKVKDAIKNNNRLSKEEKHYLFYYLKTRKELYNILTNKNFVVNEKFKDFDEQQPTC